MIRQLIALVKENKIPLVMLGVADLFLIAGWITDGISQYLLSTIFWIIMAHIGIAVIFGFVIRKQNRDDLAEIPCE